MPREQDDFSPATWRIEYLPPGGVWTLLARETSVPDGSNTLSRTYYTPQGANGTWKMRAVMESDETIVGITSSRLAVNYTATVTGKTTSKYKKSFHIPLTGTGPWDVRVSRSTPDSAQSNLQNQLWWDSLTEIVESKLSYPNSALVGASVDAEQFSDIPSRGYEIYGILCKIPSNYNPASRIYTGTWDGTFKVQWTNNPAWVFYDLLTNDRYGLGQYIADQNLDKWALYDIARYCDEKVPSGYGYVEPRFTCNCYIQTREDAYKMIANLASVFRGMAYWSAGQVTAVADMPADAISIFTNANVGEEGFSYSGSSRNARHTVALVTWNDPSDRYRQKIEYVDDRYGISKYGINSTEVVAFGCTSRGQAHRLGKWLLYTELLETDVVSFKTGLEGASVYPGAIIKVADTLRSGTRIGGRSLDASLNSITLDAPVTLSAGVAYTLSVVLPSGVVADRTVTNGTGETLTLNVSPPLPEVPQKHSMWVMASTTLRPQLFRVLSVVESGKTSVEVTALRHNKNKFAAVEYDQLFEDAPISSISASKPSTPTTLKATDTLYMQGPGVVGTKLHFSWEGKAVRFNVRWKQTGNFEVKETLTNSIDIAPVAEGAITLQVQGVDVLGRQSPWAVLNYNTLGKTALPSDVTGFTAIADQNGINLKWGSSPDVDVNRYELRSGVSGCTWEAATLIGEIYATALRVALVGTTTTYLIKAVDTSDNKSANPAVATVVVGAPATPVLSAVGGLFSVKFNWMFGDSRQDVKGTELWWSPSADSLTSALRLTFEPFPSSTYTQIGLEPGEGGWYWIRAVDNFGNVSGWNPANANGGLHAVSDTDPSALLTQLQGALGMPQMAAELAAPISQIGGMATDILQRAADIDSLASRALYERAVTDATITTDPVTGKIKLLATAAVTTDVEARLTQAEVDINAAEGTLTSTVATLSTVDRDLKSAQSQISQLSNSVAMGVSDAQIADISGRVSGAITVESAAASQALAEAALRQSLGLDAAVDKDLVGRARVALAEFKIKATATDIEAEAAARLILAAAVEGNKAALVEEQTTRANAISAETAARQTLQAQVGSDVAGVQSYASAVAGKVTSVEAKWGVKTQATSDGGRAIAGIELLSGEPGQSAFAVLADRFLVYRPDGTGAPKQMLTIGMINGVEALGFSGSGIFDGSITAKQINGDGLNITGNGRFTGEVNVGAFTGYAWPAAGGTGVHLSVNGLLAGNANGGKYFQIHTPAGDWSKAAIYTNIQAHLEDLQVTTLKIAGNAVTIPISGGRSVQNSAAAIYTSSFTLTETISVALIFEIAYRNEYQAPSNPATSDGNINIKRNGSVIKTYQSSRVSPLDTRDGWMAIGLERAGCILETLPPGTYSYSMDSAGFNFAGSLLAIVCKR